MVKCNDGMSTNGIGKDEKDSAYDSFKEKHDSSAKAKGVLRGAGYARGGGVSPLRAKKAEEKEGMKTKSKAKSKKVHKIEGKKPHARADKFARGGRTLARGGSAPKGHHTKIVINAGSNPAEKQQAMAQGAQIGAKMMAAKMGAGRPGAGAPIQARPMPGPAAPPPPGGMGGGPGAGPQGVPPTMGAKRGGHVYAKGGKVGPVRVPGSVHLEGGAGGGLGRKQKQAAYGAKPKA